MSKKRKSGQGTLRKRSDGRWEGRIVIGYNEKGLPITKGVTASEKGKCLEKLEKLKQAILYKAEKERQTAIYQKSRQRSIRQNDPFGSR